MAVAIAADEPSPIDYGGIEMAPEILAEDEEIETYPLRIPAGNMEVVPVEETVLLVESLRALGSDARLTTYPGVGHDSWTRTYADPELYEWLSRQTRSQ